MTGHRCDTGYFDRTVCPEPCGTMHSYCTRCGKRQDVCAFDPCVITPDGWCATHSTASGPVYCQRTGDDQ